MSVSWTRAASSCVCACDVGFGRCSAFQAVHGELQRLCIGLYRIVQNLLFRICAAKFEIVERQFVLTGFTYLGPGADYHETQVSVLWFNSMPPGNRVVRFEPVKK